MAARSDPQVSPGTSHPSATARPSLASRLLSRNVVVVGAILLTLAGILTVALVREAATRSVAASAERSRATPSPARPPLTAGEDAYARALWPIHSEVKLGALRMTFASINYKIGKIDRAELGARVQASREIYQQAEARLRTLDPPPSLHRVHTEYLDAIQLYQRSAREMAKVVDDGRDEHLVVAAPMLSEAGGKLVNVGTALWPGEYVPN